MPTANNSQGKRLAKMRKDLNLSQIQMAKKLGISERTLREYEKDHIAISNSVLAKLSSEFKINLNWLILNQGSVYNQNMYTDSLDEKDDLSDNYLVAEPAESYLKSFVFVPRYDIKVSAGYGQFTEGIENLLDKLPFSRKWIDEELKVNFKNLFMIATEGDSMYPSFSSGDWLLAEYSPEYRQENIYILRLQDTVYVKRLQMLLDGKLKVMSDNKLYSDQIIELNDSTDLQIIGRVLWIGKMVQ